MTRITIPRPARRKALEDLDRLALMADAHDGKDDAREISMIEIVKAIRLLRAAIDG